jgi:membrane protein DedA with SNARE-associated domain
MDLAALLHQYGYALIFVGTLVEGESLLVLGGYFAHQGYLHLGGVMLAAFCGAVCGDQLFFHLGRHHAHRLLAKFPKLHGKVAGAVQRISGHEVPVVLGMRFLWGLRIALPIAMGMSRIRAATFFWTNLVSAAAWSVVFTLVGFGASHILSRIVADLRRYEWWVAAALVVAALTALVWHAGRLRRKVL